MTTVRAGRILALTKYGGRAASTRQRLLQYGPFLAEYGIDIDLEPLLDDSYLSALMAGNQPSRARILRSYVTRFGKFLSSREYDAIWVQYELLPYLPLLDRILSKFSAKPIIYDIDDAIFHMYDGHRAATIRWLLGGKLRPLMRQAAICLCGNEYLYDYVTAAGGKAVIVPTVVDTEHFRPATRSPDRPFTVGWIGSPSTWSYVEPLLPTLLPAMARLRARFRVVGAGPAARGIEGIDALDWSEEREVLDLQAMDVGLMPAPDDPWARGKCGYKLIQYMACGVPGIASPVGVNNALINPGVDGFFARTPGDWVEALSFAANDPDGRRRMGALGRTKVVDRYSLRSQQPVVLSALRTTMEKQA